MIAQNTVQGGALEGVKHRHGDMFSRYTDASFLFFESRTQLDTELELIANSHHQINHAFAILHLLYINQGLIA